MKLGLVFGYWGAQPADHYIPLAQEAERLGWDSVWVAESWGNDAFTFAAWIASNTERIQIGTGVVQLAARTPTATAMAAVTIDHISKGRFILGLGVSGPQVVEGWYGRPSNKPLARTREYVEVIRKALKREGPLTNDGEFYPLPYRGEGSVGLGKPLKIMTHPLRSEIPIYLGAEGPKNVTQTAEIADGWLPLYYSPYRQEVYADQLKAAKPGAVVTVGDRFFDKKNLRVAKGSRLKYRFSSGELHNLTLANGPLGIGSDNLNGNRIYTQKFTRPGTYNFFCGLHPVQMSQRVVVKGKKKKGKKKRK